VSILGQKTSGISLNGQRIVIAGVEGIGKTTLACDAPNAILVPLEQGYASQTCARVPKLEWWEHVETLCGELVAGAQLPADDPAHIAKGTTIVWDSAAALERLIESRVLRVDPGWREGNPGNLTMNSVHGGYGKGHQVANALFVQWLGWQDQLSILGINTVVTSHVFAADVVDPAYGEYQTWDLLLHSPKNNKTYGKRELLTQWADMIAFMHEPVFVSKDHKDADLTKGVSQGKGRVLAVERAPSWVAKNRYGITGLISIPHEGGWNHLAQAIHTSTGIDIYKR
jgi:replicative DNA helicase